MRGIKRWVEKQIQYNDGGAACCIQFPQTPLKNCDGMHFGIKKNKNQPQ